jgi:hypothetical protein
LLAPPRNARFTQRGARVARRRAGYSLPQPHLERTRLCELEDSELDPKYIRQRDGLRGLVTKLAQRKTVGPQAFGGGCA